MSGIPHPSELATNILFSVDQKTEIAHNIIDHFKDSALLVLYGSLARGDATIRSDIDLCTASQIDSFELAFGFSSAGSRPGTINFESIESYIQQLEKFMARKSILLYFIAPQDEWKNKKT